MERNKVILLGSNRAIDQIPLVKQGFFSLSWDAVEWNKVCDQNCEFPELIYCSDPGGYEEGLLLKQHSPDSILLMQVLDLPFHISNFDYNGLKSKLVQSDAVLANSETVQRHIKEHLGLDSHVVNHPAKNVGEMPGVYQKQDYLKFLHVGRRADPNKRYNLVTDFIRKYYNEDQLINIGADQGVGRNLGEVEDKYLASIYNHCDYVLVTTKNGGIELPIIEALICGKIPIVMNDCECAMEFAYEFCADPTPEGIQEKILLLEDDSLKDFWQDVVKDYKQRYSIQFHHITIAQNIINVYNLIQDKYARMDSLSSPE